jgi:hypothetical protein
VSTAYLGDEFDYKGKYEGLVFTSKTKSNASLYPHASHATAKTTEDTHPPTNPPTATTSCRHSTSSIDSKGVHTVQFPKQVIALLINPPAHSIAFVSTKLLPHTSLLVADTGATDRMIPDKSAFISYRPVTGRHVRMRNNLFAPILGTGSVVIALNGKCILIRDYLHVPALRNPLYSLCAHPRQHRCGLIGMHDLGMYVFFPSFIIEVNTTTDCHLWYEPIGQSSTMLSINYIEPIQTCNSSSTTAAIPPSPPAIIEDKDECKADNEDVIPDGVLPSQRSHPRHHLLPSTCHSSHLQRTESASRPLAGMNSYNVSTPSNTSPPHRVHHQFMVRRPAEDPLRRSWNE